MIRIMKELLAIFWTFVKIGGLTFGGGYSMLPMLRRECIEDKGWITEEELLDFYAIGQTTPGLIAVNTSILIGYNVKKLGGGLIAALGVVFPSIVVILIIAAALSGYMSLPVVEHAFAGIRVVVDYLGDASAMARRDKRPVRRGYLRFCAVGAVVYRRFSGRRRACGGCGGGCDDVCSKTLGKMI